MDGTAPPVAASPERAAADRVERALLRRIAGQDRAAFRDLYERYYERVLRFIFRITRRLDLAEEGVNDVMLVVWSRARSFEARSSVSTWVMGIAYRKGLKLAERARRVADRFVSSEDYPELTRAKSAIDPVDGTTRQDWLDAAMQQLSANHRAVVELTYFYGYSYREIAVIMACPENTVKTRMHHARARLKALLPPLAGRAPR